MSKTSRNMISVPHSTAYSSNKPGSSTGSKPVVGCMPNCQKRCRQCNFDQDYSKNFMDPLGQRPGYFHEFNEEFDKKKKNAMKTSRGMGPNNVYIENNK